MPLRSWTWPDKVSALKWVVLTLDDYRVARTEPRDQVFILDEGIAQRAFTLFAEATGQADVTAASTHFRMFPRPDIFISLELEAAQVVQRIEGRARGLSARFEAAEIEVVERRLRDAGAILTVAREQFAAAGVTLRAFDATDDLRSLAGRIGAFIEEKLQPPLIPGHALGSGLASYPDKSTIPMTVPASCGQAVLAPHEEPRRHPSCAHCPVQCAKGLTARVLRLGLPVAKAASPRNRLTS